VGGGRDCDILRCMFNRIESNKTYRQNVIILGASSTKIFNDFGAEI
jgi:hypothetical protein